MSTYTYTVFDANPHTSSGTAWPHAQELSVEAATDADARKLVLSSLTRMCSTLGLEDGYVPGQRIYTLVWNQDGVLIGNPPTYTLHEHDLGLPVCQL